MPVSRNGGESEIGDLYSWVSCHSALQRYFFGGMVNQTRSRHTDEHSHNYDIPTPGCAFLDGRRRLPVCRTVPSSYILSGDTQEPSRSASMVSKWSYTGLSDPGGFPSGAIFHSSGTVNTGSWSYGRLADNQRMIPDKNQRESAYDTYEGYVEEHGLVRGTVKYYKSIFGGE